MVVVGDWPSGVVCVGNDPCKLEDGEVLGVVDVAEPELLLELEPDELEPEEPLPPDDEPPDPLGGGLGVGVGLEPLIV